jgi:hypothetical protein
MPHPEMTMSLRNAFGKWLSLRRGTIRNERKSPAQGRKAKLAVELLEGRIAPAINFAVSGGTVQFLNDGSAPVDNQLELAFSTIAPNDLGYSINGGPFTDTGVPFTPLTNIVANLGPGNETLIFNLQTFAFNTVINPDAVNSQQTNATLTDTGSGHAVTLNILGTQVVNFTGVGGDDNLTVQSGFGDNTVRVDNAAPSQTDEVIASDMQPTVQFNGINTFTYAQPANTAGTDVVTFATRNLAGAQSYHASLDPFEVADTLAIEGTGAADQFLVTKPASAAAAITDLVANVTVTADSLGGQLEINTLGGDDTVTVDASNGAVTVPINVDGGAGRNQLILQGGSVSESQYYPDKLGNGQNLDFLIYASGSENVYSSNVFEITDSVSDTGLFDVFGNGADNAITYVGATSPSVTVDNNAILRFTNKSHLTLAAEAGNDTISINSNGEIPTGLTQITVGGGDPTAGTDTLVVNGIAGVNDDIFVTPTGTGTGTITDSPAAAFVPVSIFSIEHLSVVGQPADADGVRIVSTAGDDSYTFTPDATGNGGTITGTANSGAFNLTPVTVSGFTSFIVPLSQTLGGTDTLTINGTSGDDEFDYAGQPFPPDAGSPFGAVIVNHGTPLFFDNNGLTSLTLAGLAGNNSYNLDLNTPGAITTALIHVQGGDGAANALNMTGPASTTENLSLTGLPTAQIINGFGANTVTATGVAEIVYQGRSGNDTLQVDPEAGPDTLRVAGAGGFPTDQITSSTLPLIHFSGLKTFAFNHPGVNPIQAIFDTLALSGAQNYRVQFFEQTDSVVVEGSDGLSDNFTVTNPVGSDIAAVRDNNGFVPGVTVTLDRFSNPSLLTVRGRGDNDTFNVNVGVDGLIPVPLAIDGGEGQNLLTISGTPPAAAISSVVYTPGPDVSSGLLNYNSGGMTINFTNVAPVLDTTTAATLTVNGTNGDNAINLSDGAIAGPVNFADFLNTSGLRFNGSAAQSGNALRLTSGGFLQAGSAFFNTPVSTTQSFSTHFQFATSGGTTPEADGLTFMIQNDPRGTAALGFTGGALGYATDDLGGGPGAPGIQNSVAVEFDLYANFNAETNANHVAVLTNGVLNDTHLIDPGFSLQNATVNAWVDYYAATHILNVFVSQTTTKPTSPLISALVDLSTAVGASGLVGFSGGSGSLTAVQDIQNWQFGVQTAQVSVDNDEPIAFANKTNLMINGLAGSDTINLNNPNTPTGLTAITVNGGDPTAGSDTLIDNVTGSILLNVTPTARGAGMITNFVSSPPPLTYTGIEQLSLVDLTAGTSAALAFGGTAGNDTYEYTPGATPDSGSVTGFETGAFAFTPVSFSGFGGTFSYVAFNEAQAFGGTDTLIVDGTSGNDTFQFASNDPVYHDTSVRVDGHTPVFGPFMNWVMRGLGGSDTFNLNFNPLAAGGAPLSVRVEGNGPSAGDTLNYLAAAGATVAMNLNPDGNPTTTDASITASGGATPVTVSAVADVNFTGSEGSAEHFQVVNYGDPTDVQQLAVDGGDFNNSDGDTVFVGTSVLQQSSLVYTPLSLTSGTLTRTEGGPQINLVNLNNADGSVLVDDFGAFANSMTVVGSVTADHLLVTNTSIGTVRITDTTAGKRMPVDIVGFISLAVNGGLGDDTLTVDNSLGLVDFPEGIIYDGGDGNNALDLVGTTAVASDVYTPGPGPGQGSDVQTTAGGAVQAVFFKNLAPVLDTTTATSLTVNGTNGDDAINYTQGSVAANGLVSVDGFEPIEFSNKTNLALNGLAGRDTINLNDPGTPAGLTSITVSGGMPGSGATLIAKGTAAVDTINFTPTGPNAGSITGAGPVPVAFSNIKRAVINGQGGNDLLTISAPAGSTTTFSPGSAPDAGSVQVNSLVPLSFTNLGNGGQAVTLGGTAASTLVYNGAAASNVFTVTGLTQPTRGQVQLQINGVNQLPIVTDVNVTSLTLNGVAGNDTFNLAGGLPYTTTTVEGDAVANLTNAIGPITVTTADGTLHTNTTIIGYGGTVALIGVATANLDTHGNGLLVNGTSVNDNITYTPTGASAGTFTSAGLSTVFNFTGDTSTFTISGQGGTANQVTVDAPAGRATISEANRVVTVTPIGSAALEPVTLAADVQIVNLMGGSGPATFQVTPAAGTQYVSDGNLDNLVVNVIGGTSGAANALVIQAAGGGQLPANEFLVFNRSLVPYSGFVRTFTAGVQWPDINYSNIQMVSANAAGSNITGTTQQPNLLVSGVTISGQSIVSASQSAAIPGQTGVSASETGSTVTITTPAAHGLQAGYSVTISGFSGAASGYNGTFVIASALTPTTFTYTANKNGIPNATGGSEVPVPTTPEPVTITTQSAHGLQQGGSVTISGFTGAAAGYNGTFAVTGVPTPTTFTYTPVTLVSLPPVLNATGASEVPNFNLFAAKPQSFTQGPTPLVNSLTISVVDQPPHGNTSFPIYAALDVTADSNPGLYTVVGDQTGNAPLSQVIVTDNPFVAGQPATATVQLIFAQPLLDDRYTLTINDNVVDPAGNQLDGASNAANPLSTPTFPSGSNGLPANFVARFTVNSRPHIGDYVPGTPQTTGQEQLDINGNGIWDPVNAVDAVNSDKAFSFANTTDTVFSGNFAAAGQSGAGFSELGAYGQVSGKYRWLLTFNNVAQPDYSVVSTLQMNAQPVAGHFNPNINADEIALFDGIGNWYIDYTHTNNVGGPGTVVVSDGLQGTAVVGSFDGSGHIEFATYQANKQLWTFDLNPFGTHNIVTLQWGFASNAVPVSADMNGDGVTDIGLYVPQCGSVNAGIQTAGWYWLVSQGMPVVGTINTLAHAFNPSPFSNDLYFTFGIGNDLPLVGHWDPQLPPAVIIGTQPAAQVVNAGNLATFTASASGAAAPGVQWQASSDGGNTFSDIGGATSTTLTLTAMAGDNGNLYRAVFSNAAGSAITNAVGLTVHSAPAITANPVNVAINAGGTATFTAAASALPAPKVQWQRSTDGGNSFVNIAGATSPTLTFTARPGQNGYEYRALFVNSLGSVTSDPAILTVNIAPIISVQPVRQTVAANTPVDFVAAANSTLPVAVQWQVSTNGGRTFTDIAGATSATLTWTPALSDSGNRYRAVFTNALGKAVTRAVGLVVEVPPSIVTNPSNQTRNAGQFAIFTASASGTAPVVQWQVSSDGVNFTNIPGAHSLRLAVFADAAHNGRQYEAVFTNPVGQTVSTAATLTINFAPMITASPTNQSVTLGTAVSFTAEASANPSITAVQWQVSTDGGSTFTNIQGATSPTLSFIPGISDSGKRFRAVFINALGRSATRSALLKVVA